MSKLFNIPADRFDAVVIGDPCNPPSSESVVLAINSISKGVLLPRLTDDQMNEIINPTSGLLVYNVTQESFYFYQVDQWIPIGSGLTGETGPTGPTGPAGPPGTGGVGSLLLYHENGTPVNAPSAQGAMSIAMGDGARTLLHGGVSHSAGSFTNSGDAQAGSYVLRGITTSSNTTEIFLDGVSDKFLLSQQTSVAFTITVIARRTDSGNEGALYELRGGIDRQDTVLSTRIIGRINKTVIAEDSPLWDVIVDADTFFGALRVKVKGEDGKTIRWVAHIRTVEVTN